MKIIFTPMTKESEAAVEPPIPASECVPDWYKHIVAFDNKKPTFDNSGNVDKTLKMCVPFADTLKSGYIQKTWQDIKVEKVGSGDFRYYYPTAPKILDVRAKTHLPSDFLKGFYKAELIWQMQWMPKLPKGYSAFITHPLNRDDLPFRTLSGIVDADDYFHFSTGNLPFLLKEDFDGIIPAGTPMYQIIPFKRDDWLSTADEFQEWQTKTGRRIAGMFWGGYKKLVWKKKSYK